MTEYIQTFELIVPLTDVLSRIVIFGEADVRKALEYVGEEYSKYGSDQEKEALKKILEGLREYRIASEI